MSDDLIKEVLEQVKISHSWMVEALTAASDEINEGNYSDDLNHAILVQELLEKFDNPEAMQKPD